MIDLRSDTVTRPTPAMRDAMMRAPLGDDVLGDDPTILLLQERVAEFLGHEAALFTPSGTMANQLAIRATCGAGDELVAHRDCHIVQYEGGAPAALSQCMVRTVDGEQGFPRPDDVRAAIRPDDVHAPITRFLALENTHNRAGGTVWPLDVFRATCDEAHRHRLHVHLDGARLMNACIAAGVKPTEYTKHVDSVAMCFSKGLGAPVGSVLASTRKIIHRAHRFRKLFGGGMRQAGFLAAACLHALDHHVERLAEDHDNAKRLARGLAKLPGLRLQFAPEATPTNMVFFYIDRADALCDRLREHGVSMISMDPTRVRAVTHLDVSTTDIDRAIDAVRAAL